MIVRELLTRLGFQVDEAGAQQYERRMGAIERHAQTLQQNLGGILGAIGVGLTFNFFKDVTSQFTDLQSRLANQLGAENAQGAMERLNNVALLTYQNTQQVIEGFLSMKSALDVLGLSVDQQVDLQQSIADGFTATGVKGEAAQRAMLWLNRAFMKGKLSAEEINGLFESSDDLLQRFTTDVLGPKGNVEALKQMAKQGKITSKMLSDFFLKKMPEFRKESEAMPVTINDAIARVQSAFRWWVYETDQATQASQKIVKVIAWFADHIEVLAGIVTALMIPALIGLTMWAGSTLYAFLALIAGVARFFLLTPQGWLLAAALTAIALAAQDIYKWVKGAPSVAGELLGDFDKTVAEYKDGFEQIKQGWAQVTKDGTKGWGDLWEGADKMALVFQQQMDRAMAPLRGKIINWWEITNDSLQSKFEAFGQWLGGEVSRIASGLFDPIKNAFTSMIDSIKSLWKSFTDGLKNTFTVHPESGAAKTWEFLKGLGGAGGGSDAGGGLPPSLHAPFKEGGAFHPSSFSPAPSRASSATNVSLSIGDVNVQSPPGSDPQEHGRIVGREIANIVDERLRQAIASTAPSFPETV